MKLDGSKLQRLRAQKRWRQSDAAKKAGVTRQTYIAAELGRDVQAIKAGLIATAFRIDLEELEARSA